MKNLVKISRIEKAFYEMAKADLKFQEYFFTYYAQKLIFLNQFYPHIEGTLTGYTDHGPDHITRILMLYEKMLKNNISAFESVDIPSSGNINFYELYLLLCATILHDVGNLLGRFDHPEKAKIIVDKVKNNFFVDDEMKRYALQMVSAHSGEDTIKKHIEREDVDYKNEEINLRFLGAILRFTDELEEGRVRVDRTYYDSIKDTMDQNQRIFWEISLLINRITPNPDGFEIEICAEIDEKNLFNLYKKKEKDVALIDELIFRIDKINNERKYYMEFVRKHLEYREIIFNLTITSTGNSPITISYKFNNDQGYEKFWKYQTHLNPENHIKDYFLQKGGVA